MTTKPEILGNGWTVLLKVALATYPPMILWLTWVTVNIFHMQSFMNSSERFSASDGRNMEVRVTERVEYKLDKVYRAQEGIKEDLIRLQVLLEKE